MGFDKSLYIGEGNPNRRSRGQRGGPQAPFLSSLSLHILQRSGAPPPPQASHSLAHPHRYLERSFLFSICLVVQGPENCWLRFVPKFHLIVPPPPPEPLHRGIAATPLLCFPSHASNVLDGAPDSCFVRAVLLCEPLVALWVESRRLAHSSPDDFHCVR